MFRNFNSESLPLNDYLKKNREAETGFKFCNGMCMKYLPLNDFFESKSCCKSCFYLFNKVKKMVENNQISFEKFKENPGQIKPDKVIIPLKRTCKTCNEEKTLDQFEATRKDCNPCRKKKAKINYEEKFDSYIPAIEKVKGDMEALKNLFRSMPVDLLKLTISHYKIHWDKKKGQTKAAILVLLIDHFQSLLNPKICLGGCGFELQEDFSLCEACKKKPKNLREEKVVSFEENLDTYMDELTELTDEMANKLTKVQCELIAKRLGISFYVSHKKHIIVSKLKAYFEEKNKALIETPKLDLSGKIELNDVVIQSRADGMINATQLCKAGGKEFSNWFKLEYTKELINELKNQLETENQSEKFNLLDRRLENGTGQTENFNTKMSGLKSDGQTKVPTLENIMSHVLDVKRGGNHSGSWIHPDLAVPLAQWISPKFTLQVSRWMRELALTNSVVIGQEKTTQELLELQKNYKNLEKSHRKILQKKTYHKFKTGPSFYIISDMDSKSVKFKPGFEGSEISRRLKEHRSSIPGCKLEFLIYSENAKLIETLVLNCFEAKRFVKNREWLYDIDIETVIRQTRTILNVANIKYTEETEIKAYNEQITDDMDD